MLTWIKRRLGEFSTYRGLTELLASSFTLVAVFEPDWLWSGKLAVALSDPRIVPALWTIAGVIGLSGVTHVVTPAPLSAPDVTNIVRSES